MLPVHERCCGIDVHKKVIVACFRNGRKAELKKFDTLTQNIRELGNWLLDNNCEIVAMESTGAYWKPIYNILELMGFEIMVVNAQHMKNVPGRKTDIKDAEWIADLLQHGLLKSSFIPDKFQRELREIVRYRKNLVEERSREFNRLEKSLQGANIKLSSIISEITGVSGRKLIDECLNGEITDKNIDTLIHVSLKPKKEEILKAMDGYFSPVQKRLVRAILDHIDDMTARISNLDNDINELIQPYEEAIKRIDALPGIGKRSAEVIIAETGIDMSRFPTAGHLASWCGLCPGNNESAGKRKSGRTTKGNKTLKSILVQSAKSAIRDKNSFFNAQYNRLVVRRGKNRATVAVAHSMLISIYHILKNKTDFKDLGSNYYTKFNTEAKANYYIKKLKELGVSIPVPSNT